MIELIQEYWRNYLYTDGFRTTGVAITLWLLVVSIGLGFCLSVPLAVARVSKRKWLSGAVWLGEVLHWQDVAAIGLMLVAIASVLWPARRARDAQAA